MTSQEFRISEVSDTAERIISQQHPESDQVASKKKEVFDTQHLVIALLIY